VGGGGFFPSKMEGVGGGFFPSKMEGVGGGSKKSRDGIYAVSSRIVAEKTKSGSKHALLKLHSKSFRWVSGIVELSLPKKVNEYITYAIKPTKKSNIPPITKYITIVANIVASLIICITNLFKFVTKERT
jgi:hypothetical protein